MYTFYGFTGVITHLGCWENTRKACKSLAVGSLFTFSQHPAWVIMPVNQKKVWSIALIYTPISRNWQQQQKNAGGASNRVNPERKKWKVLSCFICLKETKFCKCTNDNYFAFFTPPRSFKETLRPRNSSTLNTKTSKWQKEYYKI